MLQKTPDKFHDIQLAGSPAVAFDRLA